MYFGEMCIVIVLLYQIMNWLFIKYYYADMKSITNIYKHIEYSSYF